MSEWKGGRFERRGKASKTRLDRNRTRKRRRKQRSKSRLVRIYGRRPTCPYCGRRASLSNYKAIGKRHDAQIWLCDGWPECDAYVGCHPGTSVPLGTLANPDLRLARKRAHRFVDMIWEAGRLPRDRVYEEMAIALGLSRDQCHVGLFDLSQCEQAAAFARLRLRQIHGQRRT